MSKNMVEPESSQMTIYRVACWIIKATRAQAYTHKHTPTRTHRNIAFPRQQWSRKGAYPYMYVHCLSCFVVSVVCLV